MAIRRRRHAPRLGRAGLLHGAGLEDRRPREGRRATGVGSRGSRHVAREHHKQRRRLRRLLPQGRPRPGVPAHSHERPGHRRQSRHGQVDRECLAVLAGELRLRRRYVLPHQGSRHPATLEGVVARARARRRRALPANSASPRSGAGRGPSLSVARALRDPRRRRRVRRGLLPPGRDGSPRVATRLLGGGGGRRLLARRAPDRGPPFPRDRLSPRELLLL
mmetsp:Transcript_7160/g.21837  ORF Transcript_7160/g.21837 Transcript_7160/m.21837 type:complete len:220 (+) Transcript_7160:585-1244(+)